MTRNTRPATGFRKTRKSVAGLFCFLRLDLVAPAPLPHANIRGRDFPPDEFVVIPNVPVFAEHETTARNGRLLKFTKAELQAIVERCNQRIAETGDYAAITIGHTPDPGEGHDQPPVVGFAGPFKLGILGEPGQRQRYAILADFHVYRDKADVLKQHPRRSPELWLEDSYQDMYLDPISLISEPPRLDMGLLYSATRNGRLCEKYAAAAPAAMSVFIPNAEVGKKYAAEPPKTGDALMALSPEDVRAIVDALQQLDWVQWVKGKMAEEEGAPGEDEGAEAQPVGDGAPAAAEGEDALATQDNMNAPAGPAMPPVGAAEGVPPPEAGPPGQAGLAAGPLTAGNPQGDIPENSEKEKLKEYAADGCGSVEGCDKAQGQGTQEGNVKSGAAGVIQGKYARSADPVEQELHRLRSELSRERYARVNAERLRHLESLRRDYVFDPEEEMEFADAASMNDEQFLKYSKSLSSKCQRVPLGDIPTQFLTAAPDLEPPKASASQTPRSREKYAKDISERAFKYCEAKAVRGEHVKYVEILARLKRGETLP